MPKHKKQPRPGLGVKPKPGERKVKVKTGNKRRWIILREPATGFQIDRGRTFVTQVPKSDPKGYEFEEIDNPAGNGTVLALKDVPGKPEVYIGKDYLDRTHHEFQITEEPETEADTVPLASPLQASTA